MEPPFCMCAAKETLCTRVILSICLGNIHPTQPGTNLKLEYPCERDMASSGIVRSCNLPGGGSVAQNTLINQGKPTLQRAIKLTSPDFGKLWVLQVSPRGEKGTFNPVSALRGIRISPRFSSQLLCWLFLNITHGYTLSASRITPYRLTL
jgi:hypothetical protein